jgi:hypothetical protein
MLIMKVTKILSLVFLLKMLSLSLSLSLSL